MKIKTDKKEYSTCFLLIMLISIILSGVGFQYIVDMMQGVATPIYEILGISTFQFQEIYMMYSIFNLFLAPFIGLFIINFGLGNSMIAITTQIFLGILVCNFGIYHLNWNIVIAGWILVAIGGESVVNVQIAAINKWFSGKILSLAFGIKNSVFLLFGAFSDFFSPLVYLKSRSLIVPFFFAGLVSFGAMISGSSYALLDHFYPDKKENTSEVTTGNNEGEESKKPPVRLSHIVHFKRLYWLITLIYGLNYNSYSQLTHIITDLLVKKYNYEYEEAKNFIVIIKMTVFTTVPIFSYLAGRFGKKSLIMIVANTIMIITLISLIKLPPHPNRVIFLLMFFIGIFSSLYISFVYASLAFTLPSRGLNVGTGIASSMQMVFSLILAFIIGKVCKERNSAGYGRSLEVIAWSTGVCLVISVFILFEDFRVGGLLWKEENSEEVKRIREGIEEEFESKLRSGENEGYSELV